ncbi:hypothetical protein N7490_004940 [Penicillium lividum]|nr:hypothetical protein N7490_004940 [Penicillium lividum]
MENIDLLCESSGVLPGDAEDKDPNDFKRETILNQDSAVAKEAAPPATAKATTSRKQKLNNAERAEEVEEEGSAVGGFMAAIHPTPGQHRGKKEGDLPTKFKYMDEDSKYCITDR